MALQVRIDLPTGLSAREAYIRVRRFSIMHPISGLPSVDITFDVFLDFASKAAGRVPLVSESIQVFSGEAGFSAFASKDVSLADLVSACYGHLKSLARFSGAVDV